MLEQAGQELPGRIGDLARIILSRHVIILH